MYGTRAKVELGTQANGYADLLMFSCPGPREGGLGVEDTASCHPFYLLAEFVNGSFAATCDRRAFFWLRSAVPIVERPAVSYPNGIKF